MKFTFKQDSQLNDEGDYCPEGMEVEKADTFLSKDDFVPVIVTEACNWNDEFIELSPQKEWFHKNSFKEYDDD